MVAFIVDLFSGILLVEPLLGALAHDDSDATLGCTMIVLGVMYHFRVFSGKGGPKRS